MRIAPNESGGYDVEVFEWQRQLLDNLIEPLRDLLLDGSSPVLRRLYPTAYPTDAEANSTYDELVHDQLLEQKLAALDTVERSMHASSLTEDDLLQWMNAINSMRLVLGTRLDVSEDDDPAAVADDDPDRALWLSYELLSQMLVVILAALETGQ